MTQRQYSLDFRKEDVAYILSRVSSSTSCSIVGVGSVGKSNLIAHLLSPAVLAHYLGDEASRLTRLINVDANMLAPLGDNTNDAERCWSGYELLLHRLFMAFYPFQELDASEARQFFDAYQAIQDGRNPLYAPLGLRYFELALSYYLRRGFRVTFLLDEFEESLLRLPAKFFQTLRGLRDTHKSQLSYLTFSRSPLPALAARMELNTLALEPFLELFNDHVRYIGPYNLQDAQQMLGSLAAQGSRALSENTKQALIEATGRFAGLLRAGCGVLESGQISVVDTAEDMAAILYQRKSIRLECETIWEGLNDSEKVVLLAVARVLPYSVNNDTEDAVAMLVQKKLLRIDRQGQSLSIEPPVFRLHLLHSASR
ncbi:MAG: hypothetical protein L6Q98_07780 [Anaerolineae bacterium]|nr:hypothetical protein [Anaerolineae bacterium]NUQ02493.1 hypothetical protein [Anaerolineae bacterium]